MPGNPPQQPPGTIQFSTASDQDFSFGIDARSAENQIQQGYVRDLLNNDIVEKRIRKRTGYQGYAGEVPVRVQQLIYDSSASQVCLLLDSSISLDNIRSTPITVFGRSSSFSSGGPFTTAGDSLHYYPEFTIPIRKTFSPPSGVLNIPASEHGILNSSMFVGIAETTDQVLRSYRSITPDSISVDTTTYAVSVEYTDSAGRDVFVFESDETPTTGSSYTGLLGTLSSGSTHTYTVSQGVHGLASSRIVGTVQVSSGSTRVQVIPDSLLILTNGDIQITVTNNSGVSQTYYTILSAPPASNILAGTVANNTTGSVVLQNVTSPWVFQSIYLEQTPGGIREQVLPDSIVYDDLARTLTIQFANNSGSTKNYIIYYKYGQLRSNQLCVTDTVSVSGTDISPQITLWGLVQQELYADKQNREGWVTHVDSYRRTGEQRLVCSLGGNLYSAREYTESAVQYGYPLLYPNLSSRTSTNLVLGPLIWDTGETPARTRGYITANASASHWASITAVQFDVSNSWTKLTISMPGKQILDSTGAPTSLSSVVSTTTGLEDYLTVEGMSYALHNGVFPIKQVLDGVNQISVWVDIPENSSDWDDSQLAGQVGVFTDQLQWLSTTHFIPGDVVSSDLLGSTHLSTVQGSSGITTVLDGMDVLVELPGGSLLVGSRISSVIPLRTSSLTSTPDVTNLARGDMLSYTGISRQLRVLHINPDVDRTVSIATGVVTLGSGDTNHITPGSRILLTQAGVYTGVATVSSVTSSTQFLISTTETAAVTGAILVGKTAEIDESLSWADSIGDTNVLRCETRWIPVEAPQDSYNLTTHAYVSHLPAGGYTQQKFLRSTTVVNNMYLTNSQDSVLKFDGTNVYRAGLLPWQPGLFLTQDTGATGKIVVSLRSVTYSASNAGAGRITIALADEGNIPVGTPVRLSGSTDTYTISSYSSDTTNAYITMDRSLDGSVSAAGTAAEIGLYKYYFRLNAVDANNNLIASASTGSQDHSVELTADAAIQLKLVGMPAWDIYDYTRLEVQIYRTHRGQAAPFYLVSTIPMQFQNSVGYILYTDTASDEHLSSLDKITSALKGQELGIGWSDPIRAKYITSINNKLILGNLRDYPQLDIVTVGDSATPYSAFSGKSLVFHRDDTNPGSTTDNVNNMKFTWYTSLTGTATVTPGVDQFTISGLSTTPAVGSWVYLTYNSVAATGRDTTLCGWWQIRSGGAGTYVIGYPGLGSTVPTPASVPTHYVSSPDSIPVYTGVDGSLGMVDGNLPTAIDSPILVVMRRTALALNAAQRMVDRTISGQESYQPWLVARGGNDTAVPGRMVIRSPRESSVIPSVTVSYSGFQLFINDRSVLSGSTTSATTRVYPSRILASYPNYPEIMDSPTAILDTQSDSAVDINSADGQEITGIIPFFGDAVFTAAQQSQILVVFKSNSIYLVDLDQKDKGLASVQKIESQGLGCTAPYSIAATRNGIMFANESGLYCLRRDQSIEYLGKFMERNWIEKVDRANLEIAHGHHFGVKRQYKLALPILADESGTGYVEPSQVYVYDHTLEGLLVVSTYSARLGAWSRYDNHPSIGWVNQAADAFFASTHGRVFLLRNTATLSDYRDDSTTIESRLDTRPNDFGASGIRKLLDAIVVHYRSGATSDSTTVQFSTDLSQTYTDTTAFRIRGSLGSGDPGMGTPPSQDITTILHKIDRRRGGYFSLRIQNTGRDEDVEVAGVDYKVGGFSEKGFTQAAQTKKTSS